MPTALSKRRLLLIIFASFLIWMVIRQYLFCPSFEFETTGPFAGKQFYNPYRHVTPDHWLKCNFHAHCNAWHGLTNGQGTAKDVYHMYDSMHYAVHCVSDYQSINKTFEHTPGYIPAYEHGYNLGKTHQLVLGSNEVKWIDYLLPQSLDNKQEVLNSLSGPDNLVIVNHPLSFHGYHVSDFRYLQNYQCMEVLSPYAISTACWDAALSAGKPVFVVGDDDEHYIFSKASIAKMCTYINANATDQKTVLHALKSGESYGVILGGRKKALPVLDHLTLRGDSLELEMSEQADQISFFGQGGKLLKQTSNTCGAVYVIKPADHYVRAVVEYPSGTSIFLNPVFRYDQSPGATASFRLNSLKTNMKRVLGLVLFVLWARIAIPFVFSKSSRRNSLTESFMLQ